MDGIEGRLFYMQINHKVLSIMGEECLFNTSTMNLRLPFIELTRSLHAGVKMNFIKTTTFVDTFDVWRGDLGAEILLTPSKKNVRIWTMDDGKTDSIVLAFENGDKP